MLSKEKILSSNWGGACPLLLKQFPLEQRLVIAQNFNITHYWMAAFLEETLQLLPEAKQLEFLQQQQQKRRISSNAYECILKLFSKEEQLYFVKTLVIYGHADLMFVLKLLPEEERFPFVKTHKMDTDRLSEISLLLPKTQRFAIVLANQDKIELYVQSRFDFTWWGQINRSSNQIVDVLNTLEDPIEQLIILQKCLERWQPEPLSSILLEKNGGMSMSNPSAAADHLVSLIVQFVKTLPGLQCHNLKTFSEDLANYQKEKFSKLLDDFIQLIAEIKENYLIIKNSSQILFQCYNDKNCLFANLPLELIYKIAGSAGHIKIHNENESLQIAKRNFGLPTTEPSLCEKGANVEVRVEVRDNLNFTALIYAARYRELTTVKYLVETAKADITAEDINGDTALSLAAESGDPNIVRYLQSKGGDIHHPRKLDNQTPLMAAAKNGKTAMVQWLCERGANIEARDSQGWTVLIYTVRYGRLDTLKYLVETAKADVKVADKAGNTVLSLAAERGDTNIVQYLQSKGGDLYRPAKNTIYIVMDTKNSTSNISINSNFLSSHAQKYSDRNFNIFTEKSTAYLILKNKFSEKSKAQDGISKGFVVELAIPLNECVNAFNQRTFYIIQNNIKSITKYGRVSTGDMNPNPENINLISNTSEEETKVIAQTM